MKKLLKLFAGLVVLGFVIVFIFPSDKTEDSAKNIAKTEEQIRQDELKQTVNMSRGLCRSMVKDRAKFPDTVKFISVLHQVKGHEVDVRLEWTAENKLGNPIRYKTVCVTENRKPVLFTVDDKVLIDSKS